MSTENEKEVEKKKNITKDRLGRNPYLRELKVKVNTIPKHGQYEKDKDGEYYTVMLDLEADSYCRVYSDSGKRLAVSKLSDRAKGLLLWLMYEAEIGCEWIWVNNKRYMREAGIKAYNTYKDALRELLLQEFIMPTVIQSTYWINPNYFFNGSRIKAFPDNLINKVKE